MHNKLRLILFPFVVSVFCEAKNVSNPTNIPLENALETADAQTVCDLLANGCDCNARFGEKKRTGLMISVDHLAGELLELEEKIVEKTSYMDILGGACIAGGMALLVVWLLSPAKQTPIIMIASDPKSPTPGIAPDHSPVASPISDSPSRTHRRARSASSQFQINVSSPTPPSVSENNGNRDEKYPTAHLNLTPPPPRARLPKDARVISEEIQPIPEEPLHKTSPRARNVQQVQIGLVKAATPSNVPAKKPSSWKRFKQWVKQGSSCVATPPDSPPRMMEQLRPVAPQFSLPVGGTAIVAGAAAITSHNTAIAKAKRRIQNRVRIIRAFMEAEQIDCQAQDADGKTVVDIMNGCKGCKLNSLRTVWEEVREMIVN